MVDAAPFPGTEIDPQRPSAARVYDYFLGGSHNFAADRHAAAAAVAEMPDLPHVMRANRQFLQRAVTAVAQAGVDQFLDLGSGIPTAGNVHEVARAVRPDARVVYVDIEPVAVVHGRQILSGDPDAAVLHADLTDTATVLEAPEVRRIIAFDRPVCVLAVAVAHFLADTELLQRTLEVYRDAVAPGSHLVFSHATAEGNPEQAERARQVYNRTTSPLVLRDRAEVTRLLDGWELLDPGLTTCDRWRPDPAQPAVPETAARSVLAAVARKQ